MTRSEYQELVEFIGRQFAAMTSRLTRVEVSVEENRHHIQIVTEGVTAVREDMAREFTAVRREMADGFEVHGNLIQGLAARMDRWEGRSA
jgi:hypothetical protein